MIRFWSYIIAIPFFIIACDKKQQHELETNREDLIGVRVEPVIIKVNEDSLKTFTPGKNGVLLPEVVKAVHSNIKPYTGPRAITPGISYLNSGRKSKFPDTVKYSNPQAPASQTIEPKIFEILDPVQISLDSIDFFNNSIIKKGLFSIQNGDTIYPPLKVIASQPQPSPILSPRYKDNAVIDIKYLDVDQGLHTSVLRTMMQDENGNFWFGSHEGGLAYYDGTMISTFTTTHGLSSNSVLSILRDSNGNFWFGTFEGGVILYDGQSFIHYKNDQGLCHDNELPDEVSIHTILEDHNGVIWFASYNGLSSYDGQSFTNYTTEQGLIHNIIYSIHDDKKGNIWIGTQEGVSIFNGSSFKNFTNEQGLVDKRVNSIYGDLLGNVWIGTTGGLSYFDGTRFINYTVDQGLPNNVIISIYEDHSDNIWIGTNGGVSKYNGKSFTNFKVADGLSHNIITSFLEDQNGNLWITSNGGVMVYNEHSFTHYTSEPGLAYYAVSSIIEDNKGNFWMATNGGGLSVFDGEKFTNYIYPQVLPSNYLYSVYEDSRGYIWIGYRGGTSRYNGESFTHFSQAQGFNCIAVWSILEDLDGNMWFGTYNGVFKFDGKTFTHFTSEHGLPHYFVTSINKTSGGSLIFATNGGGVSFFDGKTFSNYSVEQGLANNDVYNIHVENDTSIWFSTNGGGVSLFNGEKFTNFTTDDGLSENRVYSVATVDNGNIWLATKNGLNHWNSASLAEHKKNIGENLSSEPYVYGKEDGLKGINFQSVSMLHDSKNRMWWGSDRSLTMLELNDFKLQQNPPKILLRQIDINGKFIDFRNISLPGSELNFSSIEDFSNYPQDLELAYHLNHLTFHFSATDWSAPHKLKYSYKVEGIDDSWSQPTEEASANYRNMPHGGYTFKVRAIGGAQKWSEPVEYSFVILPPLWHTWWARIGYVFTGILSIITIVKLRTKALQGQKKQLETTVVERTATVVEQKEEILSQNEELSSTLEQLKSTQGSLVQSEKMASLGQLTAGIAHEINNPVSFTRASSFALDQDIKDITNLIEKYQSFIQKTGREKSEIDNFEKSIDYKLLVSSIQQEISDIKEGTKRTSEIVKNLREFSHEDHDEMELADIHQGIDATLNLLKYRLNEQIILTKKYDQSIGLIKCHIGQLNQVFLNLLTNAIDAIEEKGKIQITTKNQGDSLIISITDDGKGIPKEEINKIFDPFFTTKKIGQGVGLGLSISHRIINDLGGTISVISDQKKETSFDILIPIIK